MNQPPAPPVDASERIEFQLIQFERERERGEVDLRAHCPPQDDPDYSTVVTELARIDLEYRFNEGKTLDAARYCEQFANVFSDPTLRREVAFEEYRLRRRRGEDVDGDTIGNRYGIDGSHWPKLKLGDAPSHDSCSIAQSVSRFRRKAEHVVYPQAGETFAGYSLITLLGQGAYSRVFLARQPDLAGRTVVLKITPRSTDESDRLASLQHSSIVPVYSLHREGDLTAICMPFLGATTLAELSVLSKRNSNLKGPTQELISTIAKRRQSTIRSFMHRQAESPDRAASASSPAVPRAENAEETDFELTPNIATGLAHFTQMDYGEALLELICAATEGLVHAHQRGVIHRDLKPANILVADDGTAILLDFNLSAFTDAAESQVVGGTLPYMSPQQLETLASGHAADPRDDVFSMGVILYELLCGELPFDSPDPRHAFDLDRVIKERRQTPPAPRSRNPKITPGLESIICQCIAPAREDRYQNAEALLEDLRRFQNHQPLRFAPDPSAKERLAKWCVRHPKITSTTTVTALAVALLLVFASALWQRGKQIASLDALKRYEAFQDAYPAAMLTLSSPGRESELLASGLRDAVQLVEPWNADRADWQQRSDAALLPTPRRLRLTAQLAALASEMAAANQSLSLRSPLESQRMLPDQAALDQLAANLHPTTNAPHHPGIPSQLPPLDQAAIRRELKLHPTNILLWFELAVAQKNSGRLADALASFGVADQLSPDVPATLINRGLCYLEIGDPESAHAEFDHCVRLRPDLTLARYNRAVSAFRLGRLREASKDLEQLFQGGFGTTRMHLLRARVFDSLGQKAAAEQARLAAEKTPPVDASDWVALGIHRLASDPQAALKAFQSALTIDPYDVGALNNAAHVLSERLNQPPAAMKLLDRLVEQQTTLATPYASRGILHARIGDIERALDDARSAARREPEALQQLQLAGIYALASATEPDAYQTEAIRWLASALSVDPSLASLAAGDQDLAPLRHQPRFQQLLASASLLNRTRQSPPLNSGQ